MADKSYDEICQILEGICLGSGGKYSIVCAEGLKNDSSSASYNLAIGDHEAVEWIRGSLCRHDPRFFNLHFIVWVHNGIEPQTPNNCPEGVVFCPSMAELANTVRKACRRHHTNVAQAAVALQTAAA